MSNLAAIYSPNQDGSVIPSLGFTKSVSLTGLTVGTHDFTIATTSTRFTLLTAFLQVTNTITGGLAAITLGSTIGGTELLLSTSVVTSGTIVGALAADLGIDINASKALRAIYISSKTISLRVTVTVTTLTAGDLEICLAGFPF